MQLHTDLQGMPLQLIKPKKERKMFGIYFRDSSILASYIYYLRVIDLLNPRIDAFKISIFVSCILILFYSEAYEYEAEYENIVSVV